MGKRTHLDTFASERPNKTAAVTHQQSEKFLPPITATSWQSQRSSRNRHEAPPQTTPRPARHISSEPSPSATPRPHPKRSAISSFRRSFSYAHTTPTGAVQPIPIDTLTCAYTPLRPVVAVCAIYSRRVSLRLLFYSALMRSGDAEA